MASEAQINANRENAQKSPGPTTIDGLQRCKASSVTHGLTAKVGKFITDSEEAYQQSIQNTVSRLQPANEQEAAMVHDIAEIEWKLRRAAIYEQCVIAKGFFDNRNNFNNEEECPAEIRDVIVLGQVLQTNSKVLHPPFSGKKHCRIRKGPSRPRTHRRGRSQRGHGQHARKIGPTVPGAPHSWDPLPTSVSSGSLRIHQRRWPQESVRVRPCLARSAGQTSGHPLGLGPLSRTKPPLNRSNSLPNIASLFTHIPVVCPKSPIRVRSVFKWRVIRGKVLRFFNRQIQSQPEQKNSISANLLILYKIQAIRNSETNRIPRGANEQALSSNRE